MTGYFFVYRFLLTFLAIHWQGEVKYLNYPETGEDRRPILGSFNQVTDVYTSKRGFIFNYWRENVCVLSSQIRTGLITQGEFCLQKEK